MSRVSLSASVEILHGHVSSQAADCMTSDVLGSWHACIEINGGKLMNLLMFNKCKTGLYPDSLGQLVLDMICFGQFLCECSLRL